jgi:hypothetical protein
MYKKKHRKILELEKLYESYPVEELEKIAVCAANYRKRNEEKIEAALNVRKHKLNNAFVWTPENKEKLLYLNTKLIECFEKLKAEADTLHKTLQERIDKNDSFLCDFDIEVTVIPYVFARNYEGDLTLESESEIYEVLYDKWDCELNLSFRVHKDSTDKILYLDRTRNWNEEDLRGEFDEHYISYGIYKLYKQTEWSFHDILKINYLDTSVNVDYQHFMELEK